MNFSVKTTAIQSEKTACLVVFMQQATKLTGTVANIDKSSNGYISSIIKGGDISGKSGETLLLHKVPHLKAERILLVGIGKKDEQDNRNFNKAFKSIFEILKEKNITDAVINLDDFDNKKPYDWKVKQAILQHGAVNYSFDKFKSNKSKSKESLKKLVFFTSNQKETKEAEKSINEAFAIVKGILFNKDLVNTPGNICNPEYLEKQSKALAKSYTKLTCKVLNKKQLESHKMGAILAVGQGSNTPPRMICLEYKGGKSSQAPYVLVGKGITFDTGGNSIKPGDFMMGMKYDMSGSASVLGTLKAICELKLPINVVGILAVAENMPGADAQRPDDIITAMDGTTIEVLNTDAEGRLVLCDALSYAKRYKPAEVVDIATLTGAIVVTLGKIKAGLFSNNDKLANSLIDAGLEVEDTCWRLPLSPEYTEMLKSPVADLANIGLEGAGSITAASFLEHFVDYPWAHLDIAGVASVGARGKGVGTGRPVSLLVQYLINKVK